MRIFIKYALIVTVALVVFAAAVVGWVLYRSMVVARDNAVIIERVCQLPVGTPIEDILPLARQLGIKEEGELSALGQAIVVTADPPSAFDATDDRLTGFINGTITLGKTVLYPFERHYCEIKIVDRKIAATKIIYLD